MDEPSEGIQPSIVQTIAQTLREIARAERLTILVVEQNLDLVMRLAQRCLFIENGRIVETVATERLREDRTIIHRYLAV